MGMSCLSWRAICQELWALTREHWWHLLVQIGMLFPWDQLSPSQWVSLTPNLKQYSSAFIIIIIIFTSWILCCTWSGMPILCCSVPGCSDRCEAGPVQGRSPGLKIKVRWIINWPLWGYEIARLDGFFAPQETICLHCAKTKVDTSRNLMGPEQQKKLSSSKYHSSFPPPSCGLTSWNWL